MLVVNFPHNPTGYLPEQSLMDQLAKIVEAYGLILFCDEMYAGLVHSGRALIKSAAEMTDRSNCSLGLSKTYGLPGLRSGWLVVKDKEIRQDIINWKFYTSICPPAPSELLTMAAWKIRDRLRDKSISLITENLNSAETFFKRWPDLFIWRRPMAGFNRFGWHECIFSHGICNRNGR